MKAGLIRGEKSFRFEEVAEPVMRRGGAIVDILFCGICGSDVSAFKYGHEYPAGLCGHEWVGIVKDIDEEIPGISVGTRVVCSAAGPCGINCKECMQGHYAACTTALNQMLGIDGYSPHSGGFAPRHMVNARRLVAVPEALSDTQAAMVEPATVATHGVRRSGIMPGERVGVIGAGPIGLFALQSLVAAGARDVVVVDPDAGRRKLALSVGAHHAWQPGKETEDKVGELTGGIGLDRVYDCAGHGSTLQAAGALTRRQGMIMLIGYAPTDMPLSPATWVLKELQMRASLGYDKADTIAVMGLMASGDIKTSELHTDTIPIGRTGDVIAEMAAGSGHVKVIVDVNV